MINVALSHSRTCAQLGGQGMQGRGTALGVLGLWQGTHLPWSLSEVLTPSSLLNPHIRLPGSRCPCGFFVPGGWILPFHQDSCASAELTCGHLLGMP